MIMKLKYWTIAIGVVALFASAQASAGLITFEDAPGLGLADNGDVANEYQGSDGVTFKMAILEKYGDSDSGSGFTNDPIGENDVASNDQFPAPPGLGGWFLRSSKGNDGSGYFLIVNYDFAVTEASGQIWDIDGGGQQSSEKWKVEAWNGGTLVDSIFSPEGTSKGAGSLNGLPWTFTLSTSSSFDTLKFEFVGTKTNYIGLAFDNFNTNSSRITVPAPSVVWIFGAGLGLLGLGAGLRRRKYTGGDLAV